MNEWDTPCVDNGGDWCLIALLQVSCQLVEDAKRVMLYSLRRGDVIGSKRFLSPNRDNNKVNGDSVTVYSFSWGSKLATWVAWKGVTR